MLPITLVLVFFLLFFISFRSGGVLYEIRIGNSLQIVFNRRKVCDFVCSWNEQNETNKRTSDYHYSMQFLFSLTLYLSVVSRLQCNSSKWCTFDKFVFFVRMHICKCEFCVVLCWFPSFFLLFHHPHNSLYDSRNLQCSCYAISSDAKEWHVEGGK